MTSRRTDERTDRFTDRFTDKVVLLTGGASGIGRATARRLADEGARVRIGDVVDAGMTETAAGFPGITAKNCNVADEASVTEFVDDAVSEFGRIDVVVNLAGVLGFGHTHEFPLDQWRRIIDINLTGTFLVCRETVGHLVESGGVIVNTASTAAHIGQPWAAAYAASKGGVLALTRELAIEYGRQGVRVNSVSPGGIDTPITSAFAFPDGADRKLLYRSMPLGAMGAPEDVAATIAFLAGDESSYLNGADIRVDGATTA